MLRLRTPCWIVFWITAVNRSSFAGEGPGPLVHALWLLHRHGTSEAVLPEHDEQLKGRIARAPENQGVLTAAGVEKLMERSTFARLAGDDQQLDAAEVKRALDADVPESRRRLDPGVREHFELLTTSFDLIDAPHREASAKLVDWIVAKYQPGQPLHVTVICTGNSRRSIIGATLGNVAAAYYGFPEIHFHSGGTSPSAFNRRSIATLREIGIRIEPTGDEAPRGDGRTANPVYRVHWGSQLEGEEFSKTYLDPKNPQRGFAALLVCGEADAACPVVRGVSIRIAMPYLDPKIYDGSVYESVKYAERRDDMGRLMLCVLMQVRNRLGRVHATP
jgi:hypothetical protein